MQTVELEKTYLAKYIPEDLATSPSTILADSFFPAGSPHPKLRLRRNGDSYEITKKQPISGVDSSAQTEDTIALTAEEYAGINQAPSKKFTKNRYQYVFQGHKAEIDVYQGELLGLVVVDFEFETEKEKDAFEMPAFCLVEVTQEEFVAGGMLCGKKYSDIQTKLEEFDYKKLHV